MLRSLLLTLAFALGLGAVCSSLILAADDDKMEKDKVKAKEKEPVKGKEKEVAKGKEPVKAKEEESDASWSSLLTVSNAAGNKQFDVAKASKVKFSWETTPDGQVPNFRVTVAKQNARTDSFQTFATIATTHGKSKDSATMNLGPGKYRVYIATKFMKFTLTVEGKEK